MSNEKILYALRILTTIVTGLLLRDIFKMKNTSLSVLTGGGIIVLGGVLYFILKTQNIKIQMISTSFYFTGILAVAFFVIRGNDDVNSDRKFAPQIPTDFVQTESAYQHLIGKWKAIGSGSEVRNIVFMDDSLAVLANKTTNSYLYSITGKLVSAYENDSVRFVWSVKEVSNENLTLMIGQREIRFRKEP